MEPFWLSEDLLIALNETTILHEGGLFDAHAINHTLLASACNAPQNNFYYDGVKDYNTLASLYCERIAANHAFKDGNKRTSLKAMIAFLQLNSQPINLPTDNDVLQLITQFVNKDISIEEFRSLLIIDVND